MGEQPFLRSIPGERRMKGGEPTVKARYNSASACLYLVDSAVPLGSYIWCGRIIPPTEWIFMASPSTKEPRFS